MNIRNSASSQIFFDNRVGRPMSEDRSLLKVNFQADFWWFNFFTGKEADN
ncbi:hypothetical protein SAMN04487988_101218 [Algoriphagus hitonicola]|uniref:Uncharacterized protein n=1 Tax=Algoriphagus hitonicola TaxID=435880 RepID=A0A1I2NNF0_9BACT|nr:hypothetical protein SAMN04487988_101218 [Algoriphagus hitonicola]